MLEINSEVVVINEKYKNVKGVVTGSTLEIVYEITPENGKKFFVPKRDLEVIKDGEE